MKHQNSAWAVLIFCLLAALILGSNGCERIESTAPQSSLRFINGARSGWRISVAPLGGGEVRSVSVPFRGDVRLELQPGAYLLSQTLLDIRGDTRASRQVNFVAEAGQHYTWRLLTLLSEKPDEGTPR